jgi:solute carrier family 45 protein 1/2/4
MALCTTLSLATPIITTLGINETFQPIIWYIVPFTDLIVQPIIGFYSDQMHAKWGRRRPFILVGGIGIFVNLFLIYFSQRITLLNTNLAKAIFITAFSPLIFS